MLETTKNIPKIPSLRRNFSWTLFGNIIYAASQWGILIALAQLGSPEMVGIYGLALAITAPVILLSNFQLRSIQATDTNSSYQFGHYLSLRLITSFIALAIIIFIVKFSGLNYYTEFVIIIIGVSKVFESISDVIYGLLQKNEQMNFIAISRIIKGLVSLGTFIAVIWITGDLVISVISLSVTWLLILIMYDFYIATKYDIVKPLFNIQILMNLLKLALPLGIVIMLGSLNSNIPRYFIQYNFNTNYLGYFTVLVYLIIIGETLINALGQAVTPRLAKHFSYNKFHYFNLMNKLIAFSVSIGIIGIFISIFLGEKILVIIYGIEYAKYSNVFVVVMVAGAIGYIASFMGYGITAARFFKIQPVLGVSWIITSLISSFFLIPKYGLMGAAYTLVITAVVQVLSKSIVLFYIRNQ